MLSLSTTAGGGADDIDSGSGDDILIGGRFGDTIDTVDGDNFVIGDSGEITASDENLASQTYAMSLHGDDDFSDQPITLGSIKTISVADGGDDDITTGSGSDIVLGGISSVSGAGAKDVIRSGAGADVVIGDAGTLVFDDPQSATSTAATLNMVTTTDPTIGGVDYIYAGSDNDFVFGGTDADVIWGDRLSENTADNEYGEPDSDLIFGDHGRLDGVIDADMIGLADAALHL